MTSREDGTAEACRRAVVALAEERTDGLVAAIFESIVAELPEYGAGRSRTETEEVRSGLRRSVELCLGVVAERRSLRPEEVVGLRLLGGQRARQGISRSGLVAAVRIATRVGRVFLMTCGEDVDADPAVLLATYRDITALLDTFEDEATTALEEGYDEGYRSARAIGDRGEAILVDRLLERRFDGSDDILSHAADVGLLPSQAARVVVIVGRDDAALRTVAAQLRSRLRLAAGPTRSTHATHLPLVIQPADKATDWIDSLGAAARESGAVLVYADRAVPLPELWSTYQRMRESLPYLRAATVRPGAISALIPRCHRVVFAGTDSDRRELLEDVLGPFRELAPREAAELLEVVEALYETGGSATGLARHLHLHKNTVANRLRRVREVTTLDPRCPKELLVLETVLCLQRVMGIDLRSAGSARWEAERPA